MDSHHRRANPDARDQALVGTLQPAGIVSYIGRRTAHVESDQLPEPRLDPGPDHADDTAGGAGQDRVLALEEPGVRQPAVGAHEHQSRTAAGPRTQGFRYVIHVAAENRREVGIDDSRISPRHQSGQRTRLVARRHLGEPRLAGDLGGPPFMGREPVTVQERDRHPGNSVREGFLQRVAQHVLVQWLNDGTVRPHAFRNLCHPFVERLRQDDMQVEQPGPVLVSDAKQIPESRRGHIEGPVAGTLEERIRCDRRSHLHVVDGILREGLTRAKAKEAADPFDGSVPVGAGVFREELSGVDRALRIFGDDVGKGAAPVDPDAPARAGMRLAHRQLHCTEAGRLTRAVGTGGALSGPSRRQRDRFQGRARIGQANAISYRRKQGSHGRGPNPDEVEHAGLSREARLESDPVTPIIGSPIGAQGKSGDFRRAVPHLEYRDVHYRGACAGPGWCG